MLWATGTVVVVVLCSPDCILASSSSCSSSPLGPQWRWFGASSEGSFNLPSSSSLVREVVAVRGKEHLPHLVLLRRMVDGGDKHQHQSHVQLQLILACCLRLVKSLVLRLCVEGPKSNLAAVASRLK